MKKFFALFSAAALALSLVCTSAFAEGENFVTDQTWVKYLNSGEVTQKTEDGQTYWSGTGIGAQYSTPGIDILPALKAAIGDEAMADLTVKFDVRVVFNGEPLDVTAGVCVRAVLKGGVTVDDFKENYEGTFVKNSSGTNLIGRFETEESMSGEWTTVSYEISLEDTDVNYDGVERWMLCVDRLKEADEGLVQALEFRNVGVYLSEGEEEEPDDEPADEPDNKPAGAVGTPTPIPTAKNDTPTPTPVTINKPYNFDKYPQTLVDGTVYDENSNTNAANPTQAANNVDSTSDNNGGSNWLIYVIIGAVVVIAGGAVAAVIVIKNKKKTDGENVK